MHQLTHHCTSKPVESRLFFHKRILSLIIGLPVAIASFQIQADMWEDPENMKVLPRDISPAVLRTTMVGFSMALDVRCSHCHDEAGNIDPDSLEGYDFASDKKETKMVARDMIKMLAAINEKYVANLPRKSTERVNVTCVTCHRGQNKPVLMVDLMGGLIEKEGVEAAGKKYIELREQHYGGHTYDFSPGVLLGLAEKQFFRKNDLEGADALLNLTQKFNPDNAMVFFYRGMMSNKSGDRKAAIMHIRKAIEMEPDNEWFAMQLEKIEAGE